VYSFVVAIVSIFYLFYLNRGFTQLVFMIIRFYTWRKYKAWIEVGTTQTLTPESIATAILSGKLMFRNFRYYSKNQSIYILRGHITFRYWSGKVRDQTQATIGY
jgi:hypothetical protein